MLPQKRKNIQYTKSYHIETAGNKTQRENLAISQRIRTHFIPKNKNKNDIRLLITNHARQYTVK